jgi:hypothetical protein
MSNEFALRWQNPPEDIEWIFVEARDPLDLSQILRGICAHLVKPVQGGLVEERVGIKLPSGTTLFGLSFRGTMDRWRNAVTDYCDETGRMRASIRDGKLVLSKGEPLKFGRVEAFEY